MLTISGSRVARLLVGGLLAGSSLAGNTLVGVCGEWPRTCGQAGSGMIVDEWRQLLDTLTLQDGDVVFRRGNTWASRVVLRADPRAEYSHVGIIVMVNGDANVIHVAPGTGSEAGYVVVEPLADFANERKAASIAVYRAQGHPRGGQNLAAKAARTFAAGRLPFDNRFDADEADSLYCTELVWRAYSAAGIDVAPRFRERRSPGAASRTPLILVSDLQESPFLKLVAKWSLSAEALTSEPQLRRST